MFKIIFGVWAVGFVLAVYPLYRSMVTESLRSRLEAKRNNDGYTSFSDRSSIQPGDMAGMGALATILAVFWPLAMPFFISHLVHTKRQFPGLHHELKSTAEVLVEHAVREERLRKAALEVKTAERKGIDEDDVKNFTGELWFDARKGRWVRNPT